MWGRWRESKFMWCIFQSISQICPFCMSLFSGPVQLIHPMMNAPPVLLVDWKSIRNKNTLNNQKRCWRLTTSDQETTDPEKLQNSRRQNVVFYSCEICRWCILGEAPFHHLTVQCTYNEGASWQNKQATKTQQNGHHWLRREGLTSILEIIVREKTLPEAQRTQKLTLRLGLNLATIWRHLH